MHSLCRIFYLNMSASTQRWVNMQRWFWAKLPKATCILKFGHRKLTSSALRRKHNAHTGDVGLRRSSPAGHEFCRLLCLTWVNPFTEDQRCASLSYLQYVQATSSLISVELSLLLPLPILQSVRCKAYPVFSRRSHATHSTW